MSFRLRFTPEAKDQLSDLASSPQHAKRLRKVQKTLGLIQQDPRYPGLNSHKYQSLAGENGEDVWESYVENRTPGAWRIFWHYGPNGDSITVLTISSHL
jgi:hypothetical protein